MRFEGLTERSGFYLTTVQYSDLHHNRRGGIIFTGHWPPAGRTHPTNDAFSYSNQSITLAGNRIHDNHGLKNDFLRGSYPNRVRCDEGSAGCGRQISPGSGIIVDDTSSAMVERNVVFENGRYTAWTSSTGGPVGIWTTSSRDVTIQLNESYRNRSATGDGGGFDLDGAVRDSVMQYNYSHENDGAGYLVCQYDGADSSFNATVRYNVSANDARKGFMGAIEVANWSALDAGFDGVTIHNNTVYLTYAPSAVWSQPAGLRLLGGNTGVVVRNNLFDVRDSLATIHVDAWSAATRPTMTNDLVVGAGSHVYGSLLYSSLAALRAATGQEASGQDSTSTTVLCQPEAVPIVDDSTALGALTNYRLVSGSPAIDAGIAVPNNANDWQGRALLGVPDVGASEFQGTGIDSCGRPAGGSNGGAAADGELSPNGWTATASHESSKAASALDRNPATRWDAGTRMQNGQWFKVDLGTARTFSRIILEYAASAEDYPRGYVVSISDNDATWTDVTSGTGSSASTTIAWNGAVTARHVRVTQTGSSSSWWSIHEFRLYGTNETESGTGTGGGAGTGGSPGGGELSRGGWTASASLESSNASSALDGNPATRWDAGTRMQPGQWFKLDLGSSQTFDEIVLEYAGSAEDYPRGYVVATSDDNATWTDVTSGAGAAVSTTITLPGGVTTRYVRITQTGSSGSWWSIHEISLHRNSGGSSVGSQDPELSTSNWIASASLGSSNAWAALDRNPSTRWDTGTRMQNGQWFNVDLGTAQTFNQVVLEYVGSADDFPRGYVVAISDNNSTWIEVKTGAGLAGSTTITLDGTVTTRFVRVTQTGSSGNWWSIHEFRLLRR
ncbi:MAG: discoidin domain-containing protein [Vicinamibacterales bacterium]